MISRKFAFYVFSSYIFFFSLFCVSLADLKTHYVEDICNGWPESTLYSKFYVSGILLSVPYKLGSGECTVQLRPENGYSVVLSIYRINLNPGDQLIITDSDKFKVELLGEKLSFSDGRKFFLSDGTMSIRYTWNNTRMLGTKEKFKFVFTQVHKEPCRDDEFKCRNKMCVAKKFKCDGFNHCGDKSDQEDCDMKTEYPQEITVTKTHSNVSIILIFVCGVILVIAIIVFIVLVVRRSIQKKKHLQNKNSPPTVPATLPHNSPPTVPAAIPQNSPPMVPAAIPQNPSAPPEALVQPSVFARFRQSLRRTKPSTTPNPEEPKTESYEVPSMYPQLPEVPHLEGMDNPEFKSDEN